MTPRITGAHAILYSEDADADRAFFRDVLGFDSVDAGGGWLIFSLPPAELAVHPGGTSDIQRVSMARRIGIGRTAREAAGTVH